MDKKVGERVEAFENHMSVSWGQLAQEELAAGKRWNLLQGIAYLASGDRTLVEQVVAWCPHSNALPHPNAAQAAFIHLSRELEKRRVAGSQCLSIDGGMRALLIGLKDGDIAAYVDSKPTHLTGLDFREITCSSGMFGLAPTPSDDPRYWGSVDVNADDVVQLRQRAVEKKRLPNPIGPIQAKRGPKPIWPWSQMMGELVRIADQDGLDSLGMQADVERWAIAWLAERTGTDGPSVSIVREHISPVFQAFEAENLRRKNQK